MTEEERILRAKPHLTDNEQMMLSILESDRLQAQQRQEEEKKQNDASMEMIEEMEAQTKA